MDDQQKREQSMELTRREMYRKSRDVIRVYNPLNETFRFQWDGFVQSVPAKSSKDMERYLANHYFMKISQAIINDMISHKSDALRAKKKATGNDWVDKYAENRELMTQVPSLTDPELLKKIHKDVILGLVEEYGIEVNEEIPEQRTADQRDVYERIMGDDVRVVKEEPAQFPSIQVKEKPKPEPIGKKPKVEEINA